MSLRIVYGRAGSGKSRFCINEIAKCINEGRGGNCDGSDAALILVVPEQFTVQAEKMLLSAVSSGSIISADVVNFRRMAQRVLAQTGGSSNKLIDTAGRRIILHKAIEECKGSLKYFSRAAERQGFVSEIMTIIDEMGRYNLTPDRIQDVLTGINRDSGLYDKLNDIKSIYSRYNEILHENYIDSRDVLDILAGKLEDYEGYRNARIWIDEFSGFTPQEYRIIEALMIKAQRVTVTLCCDNPGERYQGPEDIFHGVYKTYDRLIELARANNIEFERPVRLWQEPLPRFRDSFVLAHLEKEYFRCPVRALWGAVASIDDSIGIYAGKNIYSEVEFVACRILALCRDKGYRFRDIAVVARNLESYDKAVEIAFKKYGIPFFMDAKRSLMEHPLVRLIMSALEAIADNFSYQSVFKYIKTGLLDYSKDLTDIIENYVLARNIRGGRWFDESWWIFDGSHNFSGIDESNAELVNQERRKLLEPLLLLKNQMFRKKSVKNFCEALYNFLIALNIPDIIESKVDQYKAAGEFVAASEYAQIWNIIMNILGQMSSTLGDERTTAEDFSGLVVAGFSDYKIGFIPSTLDSVHVGSVERSKNNDIKALFILGVNDGIFPQAPGKEGILSDLDREALRKEGVELAPDTREQAFAEQFMIYSVLTAPSHYLHISYATKDSGGRGLTPSVIVNNIKKIFPEAIIKTDVIVGEAFIRPLDRVNDAKAALSTLLMVAGEMNKGVKSPVLGNMMIMGDTGFRQIWSSVFRWLSSHEKYTPLLLRAAAFYASGCGLKRNPLDPGKVRALFGSNIYTSISRIERFNLCPYSFFAEYGLKAAERKVLQLSMPDIGTFVHGVVEEFSTQMKNKNIPWSLCLSLSDNDGVVLDESGNRLLDTRDIIAKVLSDSNSAIFNDSKRYQYISERLGRMVSRSLEAMAHQIAGGDFQPYKFEAGFGTGEDGAYPPLEIRDDSGALVGRLTGRIDRIDVFEKDGVRYFRVIDYKSGRKEFKLSDVYNGLSVQLVSYLAAVVGESGQEKYEEYGDGVGGSGSDDSGNPSSHPGRAVPAGCLYFHMTDSFNRLDKRADPEEIKQDRLHSYRMNGLVLNDPEIVLAMDKNMGSKSSVIPVSITKDGTVNGSSTSEKGFMDLSSHLKKTMNKTINKILSGNFVPSPVKTKHINACEYCRYTALCGFDPDNGSGSYRYIRKIPDNEIWRRIEK